MVTTAAQSKSTENSISDYGLVSDKVFTCINEHLVILMTQMLKTADKKLFDLAEKAESNEAQMQFMDCTRIFRTERNDINQLFFINLNNALSASAHPDHTEETELSLVDQDEMEEMVAITTMHTKAMNLYGEEVMHVEARLEYLELHCENIFDKEAIDPKHIREVFQKTIENIDMDIEVKLVFYRLFDEEVCSKLGVMYKAINQIFIDNGIMPEIILNTTRREEVEHVEEEVSTQVASYYNPTEKVHTDFIPRSKTDISRIVNDFMNGEMTITENEIELPESFLRKPTQEDIDGRNCYPRKDVLKALSSLQRKLSQLQKENHEQLSTEQIKQELLNDISCKNGGIVDKQVNLLDERNIDFVGMMFGAIADDESVSEIMTSLIYQLQIPVIKITMSDETVFDQENHPARQTLDLLTTAGKGINSREDRLYDELENIVDNILNEFDIDISVFEKAVDELQGIVKKEEQLCVETEKQEQKKVLQAHARNIVVNQLKMVTCNKKIPSQVQPLVLKHWSTLMLNRYIRHGRSSEQWIESVLLLKLMLKCMQPIRFKSQYEMLKNNHLALVEAVNDELYETRQDRESIAEQISRLKQHFITMLDEYGYKLVDENNNDIGADDTDDEAMEAAESDDNTVVELEAVKQQVDIARQKLAQLGDAAKPGVWYEIYNGEDRAIRRLKLSVVLTDAAQLIFVDRKGIKVIEKDAEEFAKELEENRSRILADHSTFDHALGKVITALAA